MTIIVEDGSIVSGANSYITLAEARAYGAARGVILTAIDADLEPIVHKSMDYFESFSKQFKGERVERDQPLSFPRTDLWIEGFSWSASEIPRQAINAVLSLCLEINSGVDPLNPEPVSLPVIKERVEGAVDVSYANPGQPLRVNKTQPSATHIKLLLKNSGLFAVRT